MKPTTLGPAPGTDTRGHVCPPSDAKHPSDRWETLFVYAFICKFTPLKTTIQGLETPTEFEDALLSPEATPVMTTILSRFVQNLRPSTRNVSPDQISGTVAGVLAEFFKTSERTVFWDEKLRMNVDPLANLAGGFFSADWDLKLRILRQLVELQLTHCAEIKGIIDRAWGVVHNKHKKKDPAAVPPPLDPSDPNSQESLQLLPLGQDLNRQRYWVADYSPRIWTSTNPWKITAGFESISSTREDYMVIIEKLKAIAPQANGTDKRSKLELAHESLINALEGRIENIDAEIARIARLRRKIHQKELALAQAAEIRETRTRRRTHRPDYVYEQPAVSDDESGEYTYPAEHEDDEYEEPTDEPGPSRGRRSHVDGERRRSARTAANGSTMKDTDEWAGWRGERRSTRLGAPPETQLDRPAPKRARTEDSSDGASLLSVPGESSNARTRGAAALKPTETALEQVGTKKKSKFWFYAVEPIPNAAGNATEPGPPPSSNGAESVGGGDDVDMPKSMEGSLSPASSMDES